MSDSKRTSIIDDLGDLDDVPEHAEGAVFGGGDAGHPEITHGKGAFRGLDSPDITGGEHHHIGDESVTFDDVGVETVEGHHEETEVEVKDTGEGDASEEQEYQEGKQRNIISKLILPVGVTSLVGIGLFGGYLVFSPIFFSSHQRQPESIFSTSQQNAKTINNFNPMPAAPRLSDNQARTQSVNTQQAAPSLPANQGNPYANAQVAPANAGMVTPAPATAQLSPDMERIIRDLDTTTKKLQQTIDDKFNDVNNRIGALSVEINHRLDVTDARINETDKHISSMEEKFNGVNTHFAAVEQRISTLEQNEKAHQQAEADLRQSIQEIQEEIAQKGGQVRVPHMAQADKQSSSPPVGGVNHHITTADGSSGNGSVLEGYSLRGVARGASPGSAWVKTPIGFFMVKIGQSLGDAGVVKSIKRNGDTWEVVTTAGLIEP